MNLIIAPTADIKTVEMNTPWMATIDDLIGMKRIFGDNPVTRNLSLGGMLPIFLESLPPVFPARAVAEGETWTQKIEPEHSRLKFIPGMVFEYTLLNIDGNLATITFVSKGVYDPMFVKNLLSILPPFPMGDDIMKFNKINNFSLTWDVNGQILFDMEAGRFENVSAHAVFDVEGDWDIQLIHPDKSKDAWNPKMKMRMGIDGQAVYKGDVTGEALDAQFTEPESTLK
jgi:hypothetical protein